MCTLLEMPALTVQCGRNIRYKCDIYKSMWTLLAKRRLLLDCIIFIGPGYDHLIEGVFASSKKLNLKQMYYLFIVSLKGNEGCISFQKDNDYKTAH